MDMYKRHPQDHVGIWFEERRKLGVSDTICWARYTPESGDLKVKKYQHANADGMSVVLHTFKEAGYSDEKIPNCRETAPPSRRQLKDIQNKATPYPKKIKWSYWAPEKRQTTSEFNTLFFSQQETLQIEQRAKSLKVPVTTLALWALNRSASKHLLEPAQQYTWFYPVNLRGAVDYGTKYANYSSGIYLPVENDISITDLHQRIRTKLKSGEHWTAWNQAKIAKWLPGFVIRKLYQYIGKNQFYAGSYSAMGNWSKNVIPEKESQNDLRKERWFGCPPGTKNYPISNCVINWNGQLSLTLKIHPSIIEDSRTALTALCTWGNLLLDMESFDSASVISEGKVLPYSFDETQSLKDTGDD